MDLTDTELERQIRYVHPRADSGQCHKRSSGKVQGSSMARTFISR